MGSGWGSTITLAQTARVLTVEYAFFTRGDMQPPVKFTFALDGSESKNTVMMGHGYQVERSLHAQARDLRRHAPPLARIARHPHRRNHPRLGARRPAVVDAGGLSALGLGR